jgi:hypothetical protein
MVYTDQRPAYDILVAIQYHGVNFQTELSKHQLRKTLVDRLQCDVAAQGTTETIVGMSSAHMDVPQQIVRSLLYQMTRQQRGAAACQLPHDADM